MHLQFAFAVLIAALSTAVTCQSQFILPPPPGPPGNYQDNPTHKEGQKLEVQWTSNLSYMNLILWQEYPVPPDTTGREYYQTLADRTRSTSLIWTVNLAPSFSKKVAKDEDAIFYLGLYDPDTPDKRVAACHYFNVTIDNAAVTTSVTSETTSTPSATAVSSSSAVSTTASTSTSTSMPVTESGAGLSNGAVAGIAVGATVGGLLLLGALGFLAWRHLRSRRDHTPAAMGPSVTENKPELSGQPSYHGSETPNYYNHQYKPAPVHEAP
ncbi:hypothetical protein QQS21_006629 [Conoideocrella luteorostrata]|uniref:Mid2 domain-containing protein n=1 Tax=Conoideocrella luteorostrata TaxID=1105319 RepID=A0AAJ0CRJ6_9HYPO|nr:hypothetical protein QQS21_006629 [Conoideocrella luteorostrata]